jgi:ABC-2 type transport system ATP-binding protein
VSAIVVRDLHRTYVSTKGVFRVRRVEREALRGISFEVERGELFGLLGPNGAGKTTLVKILSTVLVPTSGSALVFGHDVVSGTAEVRRRIGLVFGGERGLYTTISGRDVLEFWATLYQLSSREARTRSNELLELVGLRERADEKVWTYSRGMKQRLHLARGLLQRPELLLLDEPTIGLDPVASREMRQIVRRLRDEGTTVFLTTHYMAEAEQLCDRVAFINEGRIPLIDRPRVLTRLAAEVREIEAEVQVVGHDEVLRRLRSVSGIKGVTAGPPSDGIVSVAFRSDSDSYAQGLAILAAAGASRVTTREPTLEDVYVRLLGERGMKV